MGALELETPAETTTTWQVAHAALSRLARERAATDAEEGRWLLAAQRSAVHVHLGYGGFTEYIERLFGYRPRTTQEKLRVAQALEDLPALAQALARGELSWSAVRELTRVAVPDTEQEWLDFARGKTLRQVEQVLATRRRGDTPRSPPDPSAQRHILRFEVTAETFALFRDALAELRRRSGTALDDDSALLELARSVLGGPQDEGRASYQIVLGLCPECASARQHSTGGLVPIDPELIRMAHCDAQHIGPIQHSSTPANDLHPPSSQRQETEAPPRCTERKPAHVSTGTKNQSAHVSAALPSPKPMPPRARATQTIPPALRRAVLLRDQRRCQVPGCQNTRWLDVHHLELRSEGVRNAHDNLICMCSAHHRATHRGKLALERTADGKLRARHADGTEYGGEVKPQVLDVRAKVFSALRHLGFREGESRAALEQLRRDAGFEQSSFDDLLRAALARLRPSGARR
jgi:hypothetical protein